MANSPYVFDSSADNFARLVLENSAKGPVLVMLNTDELA